MPDSERAGDASSSLRDARYAATRLRRSVNYLRDMCKRGELPFVKNGGKYLFRDEDLDAYLARTSITGADAPPAMRLALSDDYLMRFKELAVTIAAGRIDEARDIIRELATPASPESGTRAYTRLHRWTAVFARDAYTCRYCLRRTIAPPVLHVASELFGDIFRFHRDWDIAATDPAYFILATKADHILPVSRGGSDNPDNIVTACWRCNAMKSDYLLSELPGWSLKAVQHSSWRGLTEHLKAMIDAAHLERQPYFRRWLDALRAPEDISAQ